MRGVRSPRCSAMTDLLRQEIATAATTIVVKVGTRVLTRSDGKLDQNQIFQLAEQLHKVADSGRKVVLVSSGAVGAGMGRLELEQRPADLANLQAVAAVGQTALVEAYELAFRKHRRHAAQILLTAEELENRAQYLNVRNTIHTLFDYDVIPIINENDAVSVDELQTTFGDNDRLAAIVTNLLRAPLLVLLSDVEGLYDRDPDDQKAKVVPTVSKLTESTFCLIQDKGGGIGKGGMASKLEAARLATATGENVIIASGRSKNVLTRIIGSELVGTLFLAQGQMLNSRKRWIGFNVPPRGQIILDSGARKAVEKSGRSLLPIGVIEVRGDFEKGDVVAIQDAGNIEFARGLTNYRAADVQKIKGLQTNKIADALGHCPYDEVVHRSNLVLTSRSEDPGVE